MEQNPYPTITRFRNINTSRVTFEAKKEKLSALLDRIRTGGIRLPNFQRSWRWPDSNIVSLIESVVESQSFGSVILIQTGGENGFGHCPVSGTQEEQMTLAPTHLIMDGQQRLTSMYQALRSELPVAIRSDRRASYRSYFIDMRKAINADVPVIDSIMSIKVDEKGKPLQGDTADYRDPERQYASLVFPANMVFDFGVWESGFDEYWRNPIRRDLPEAEVAQVVSKSFRMNICAQFGDYEVPVVELHRTISAEAVCRIYEKINSKSVHLDAFDLLIAHYAAKGDNLRLDWYGPEANGGGRADRIVANSKNLLSDMTPKAYLQSVSMVAGLRGDAAGGTQRSDILSMPVEAYRKHADEAEKGYGKAADFMIQQCIFSARDTPSNTVFTAVAAVLGHIGRRAADHQVRSRLGTWFWSVVYSNRYAYGSDAALGADVKEAARWILGEDDEIPVVVSRAVVVDSAIRNATRKNAPVMHKALGTRIVAFGAEDFGSGVKLSDHIFQEKGYDLHHVFPEKWCKENGIPPELYNSIVNKTPLSARTNRNIGGAAPSLYLVDLQHDLTIGAAKMDNMVRSHGINPDHLRADDFHGFFKDRLDYLITIVELDLSKPVARSNGEAEPKADDPEEQEWPEDADFQLVCGDASAFAKLDGKRFTVLEDSLMSVDENPSLQQGYSQSRKDLVRKGIVDRLDERRWRFTDNHSFKSVSAASSALSGKMITIARWKRRDGTPMTKDEASVIG